LEKNAMKKQYLPILFLGFALAGSVAKAQEAVVIANNGVKATEVSSDDLRDVFTGAKSSLKDGSRVTPVTLKGGAGHDAFLKKYVGKSDSAFRAGWRSLVFTGQASMPKAFDTEAALLDYVAATPGAIGYVSKDAANDKVKTLAVK
jgi:ABC-type phosphate transport system substrate-binding protein